MTLPVYQNAGTFDSDTNSVTPSLPSGWSAGDLLLCVVGAANQGISMSSGWTQISGSPQSTGTWPSAGNIRLGVYWRIAQAGDTAPTASITLSDFITAQILRFTNVNAANPIQASSGSVLSSPGTSVTCPSVTTSIADCLIINIVANDRDAASTANLSSWSNANLSDLAELIDQTVSQGTGGGIGIATGGLAASGSSGSTTVTNASSATAALITLALTPAIAEILAGTPEATATASAALTTQIPLTAAGIAVATADGGISTGIPLAGAASAQVSADGALSTQIALSGAAIAEALASAGLTTSILAAAAATAEATGSGALTAQIQLSGAALSEALAAADLSGAAVLFVVAAAQAAAEGALITGIPLLGDAVVISSMGGELSNGAALESVTASVASATGDLLLAIRLTGDAASQAAAGADLTTRIQLSASAVSSALARARFPADSRIISRVIVAKPRNLSAVRAARKQKALAQPRVLKAAA